MIACTTRACVASSSWQAEQRDFAARGLSRVDFVYLWADGVHLNVRLLRTATVDSEALSLRVARNADANTIRDTLVRLD